MRRTSGKLFFLVLLSSLSSAIGAAGGDGSAPIASDPAGKHTWELTSIYPDNAAWEADRRGVLNGIARLPRLRGTLGASPSALLSALDEISKLRALATKMEIYGELAHNLDKTSAEWERRFQVGSDLLPRVDAAAAFAGDEVLRIAADSHGHGARLESWYRTEPRLERHRIRITRILREATHTLPGREQALVASMERWPHVSSDLFDALHESDLGWRVLTDADGKPVPVTSSTFRLFPREQRGESARVLMARLGRYANLFGVLYTSRIEADLAIARHRKFGDGIDAMWFLRDGMPEGSARLVVEQARRNLPLLHRFFALRSRALGFARPEWAQVYVPPSDSGRSFDADAALDLAVEAAAPLGSAFQERVREAIRDGWMHLPPWPSKRGVFEVFPAIGMRHPYMLTSFRPSYRAARQITGALFDLVKDADIPEDRYPDWRDDPPIYGNGIIYVGDMLFDDLVRGREADGAAKLAYAVQAMDLVWGHFFQTALMMELDTRVQKLVIEGKPPGGEEISRIYLALLREYAGPAEVDEAFAAEWMIYGTAFYSYEHQFWAGALAAAAEIVEKIRANDPDGVKAVNGVYGRGDSDRSYYLLKQARIDMATPAPYEALMRRLRALLEEAEGLAKP